MNKKIEYIKNIDKDNELYNKFLKQKIIKVQKINNIIEKEKTNFLIHIFEQEKKRAFRIDK